MIQNSTTLHSSSVFVPKYRGKAVGRRPLCVKGVKDKIFSLFSMCFKVWNVNFGAGKVSITTLWQYRLRRFLIRWTVVDFPFVFCTFTSFVIFLYFQCGLQHPHWIVQIFVMFWVHVQLGGDHCCRGVLGLSRFPSRTLQCNRMVSVIHFTLAVVLFQTIITFLFAFFCCVFLSCTR